LQRLTLEGNRGVDDTGVVQLCAAAPATLQHLHLSACSITPASLKPLATELPALRSLGLLGCQLGSQGGAGVLAGLLRGDVATGSSPDRGFKAAPFQALEELIVSATQLDAGSLMQVLDALQAPGVAPRLTSVEVGGNPGCEDEAFFQRVEELRAARPELAVHWRSGDQAPPAGVSS
jgi:hypothetical protein